MTPESADELRRAWEYHKAADEQFAQRMNYGMVAQSMLMSAFALFFVGSSRWPFALNLAQLTIAILGLWFSHAQYSLCKSLAIRIQHLKDGYLARLDPVYASYLDAHVRYHGTRQLRIPVAFGFAWVVLLALSAIYSHSN